MATAGSSIDFCTLGMFIIDEIEFPPPKPPVKDIVGGAGAYSALGARIFSAPPLSKSVGWIVDCGSDFPSELRDYIASWDSGVVVRETPNRLTTRGWNGYGKNEHRGMSVLEEECVLWGLTGDSVPVHYAQAAVSARGFERHRAVVGQVVPSHLLAGAMRRACQEHS